MCIRDRSNTVKLTKTNAQVPATVFDSARPHPLVVAVLLGGCGASAVLGLLAGSSFALMLFLGLLAALFVWDLRPRRGPRETLIECRAGSVRARGLGTIRARDLIGATTAKHGGRVSLMLAHRRRKQTPIILDLPDEAALARVTSSRFRSSSRAWSWTCLLYTSRCV